MIWASMMPSLVCLKTKTFPPSSFVCYGCDVLIFDEFMELFDVCPNDPHLLDCESTKCQELDYVNVDLVVRLPPSIAKDEPYAVNKGSLSDYCRFIRVLLSSSHLDEVKYDFDLGIKLGGGSSRGMHLQDNFACGLSCLALFDT